jgi:DNA-binding transcriptional ArsR family regulator
MLLSATWSDMVPQRSDVEQQVPHSSRLRQERGVPGVELDDRARSERELPLTSSRRAPMRSFVDGAALLDRVFHAVGDPTRRGMLEQLSERPVSVSALAAPLDMSLAAVLQHVRVLEDCGLVSTTKVGRTRTCALEPDALRAATDWLTERRQSWDGHFDHLGTYLAARPSSDAGRPTPEERT